ncbi:DUF6506 family protein [Actinoplanes sp. NPDC051346]|uniref:DUF6506 family protein n=1 Tax=Actinoplanes sp. NPDC051346 TaxID=3155048 RepID=UPI0034268B28
MALTHWTFVYCSAGLPDAGDLRTVTSPTSTTVLAGFGTVAAARRAFEAGPLAQCLTETQLVELCGAFGHDDVATLRRLRPGLPVGLVGYAGEMTAELHAVFGD